MILANELRIGNKLSYYKPFNHLAKPVVDTVIGLLPVEEYGGVYCAYLENYSPVNIEALIPIPLTPEILESCGFKKKRGGWRGYIWRSYGIGLCKYKSETKEETFFRFCDRDFLRIYYLHQLQNLYFYLTGEELEVKLNVPA